MKESAAENWKYIFECWHYYFSITNCKAWKSQLTINPWFRVQFNYSSLLAVSYSWSSSEAAVNLLCTAVSPAVKLASSCLRGCARSQFGGPSWILLPVVNFRVACSWSRSLSVMQISSAACKNTKNFTTMVQTQTALLLNQASVDIYIQLYTCQQVLLCYIQI